MINRLSIYSAILSFPLLVACGGGATEQEKESADSSNSSEETTEKTCTYSYDGSQTTFTWTAYKFTEKAGVGGSFDSIAVMNTQESESLLEVVRTLSFAIPISSVNSNNPVRDEKIKASFFGVLDGTNSIDGKVRSISDPVDNAGEMLIEIVMNKRPVPAKFNYTLSGDTLRADGMIDLKSWEAEKAVESLNGVCEDLHKGKDGKSVLWPDVKLEIETILSKTCE